MVYEDFEYALLDISQTDDPKLALEWFIKGCELCVDVDMLIAHLDRFQREYRNSPADKKLVTAINDELETLEELL